MCQRTAQPLQRQVRWTPSFAVDEQDTTCARRHALLAFLLCPWNVTTGVSHAAHREDDQLCVGVKLSYTTHCSCDCGFLLTNKTKQALWGTREPASHLSTLSSPAAALAHWDRPATRGSLSISANVQHANNGSVLSEARNMARLQIKGKGKGHQYWVERTTHTWRNLCKVLGHVAGRRRFISTDV